MDRRSIEVEFVDDASLLLNFNTIPSEVLLNSAKKENNKYLFEIDKDKKVIVEKSNIGNFKKIIQDKKEILYTPNFIRYVKRHKFSKDLKTHGERYEILEMRWFYNKRGYYTGYHNFMSSLALVNGFSDNYLIAPNNYEKSIINEFFKKEVEVEVSILEQQLDSEKDLLDFILSLENLNKSHKGFLNRSKRIDDFTSHRNFKGESLPAQRIGFKDPIKVNDDYEVDEIELLFTKDGFIINELFINHRGVIKFKALRDETGVEIRTQNNSYGIGIENDRDGKYYTKISYKSKFPLQVGHIQLPRIYATLGKKHNFISPKKSKELIPKDVKNYKEFSDTIKIEFETVYSTVLFLYKMKTKDYKKYIKDFVKYEVDLSMSEDDVYEILNLNYQDFYNYFKKVNTNLNIYKELFDSINNYNKDNLKIIDLNIKIESLSKKLTVI